MSWESILESIVSECNFSSAKICKPVCVCCIFYLEYFSWSISHRKKLQQAMLLCHFFASERIAAHDWKGSKRLQNPTWRVICPRYLIWSNLQVFLLRQGTHEQTAKHVRDIGCVMVEFARGVFLNFASDSDELRDRYSPGDSAWD